MNEVPPAQIGLKRAIVKYKDWTYIIFHEELVFWMIVDVCESFEKGKISFEAPKHEVGKKQKIIKPMSIIWWRPLRFSPNRIVQLICQKFLDGQCFFGKKSKVVSLEE